MRQRLIDENYRAAGAGYDLYHRYKRFVEELVRSVPDGCELPDLAHLCHGVLATTIDRRICLDRMKAEQPSAVSGEGVAKVKPGVRPLGAALAVAQPGDVLEYRHLDRWWQILVDSKSVVSRLRKISPASWSAWKLVQLDLGFGCNILPLPCRLVPFDAADADPATRGLLPTSALEPSR